MAHFELLHELGLSKAEVRCYSCLLKRGPATSRTLAERLSLPQTNLYGPLDRLAERGFVQKVKLTTRPTLFIARPLNRAVREYYVYQRRLVMPLCQELGVPPPPISR